MTQVFEISEQTFDPQIVKDAIELISKPDSWIQGSSFGIYSKDKDGNIKIEFPFEILDKPDAIPNCWCLYGAMAYAKFKTAKINYESFEGKHFEGYYRFFDYHYRKVAGKGLINYNDYPGTTKEMVIETTKKVLESIPEGTKYRNYTLGEI